MNTLMLLMAQYEKPVIPLDEVRESYFGIKTSDEAKRRAIKSTLPIPAMKLAGKNSPWLVHIKDLADYVDKVSFEQRERWIKINSANDE